MTAIDTRASDDRAECLNIIASFAHFVDHREFAQAVALFAEDGAFVRPDLQAQGHAEIAAIWADRPTSVVTKHMCAATAFLQIGADSISAVTPFTLYTVQWSGEGLPTFSQPVAIAEFHDRFVRTDDGWRIAERRGVPVLLAE